MKQPKYRVTLSPQERDQLTELVRVGQAAAYRRTHAQILLLADEAAGAPAMPDTDVATACCVSAQTVVNVRKRLVLLGLDAAVNRKQARRPPVLRYFDGAAEARLLALACGKAPEGHARWTLRLLADKAVELHIVEKTSPETVRRVLKKTTSSRT